jgi:hypothetical protein
MSISFPAIIAAVLVLGSTSTVGAASNGKMLDKAHGVAAHADVQPNESRGHVSPQVSSTSGEAAMRVGRLPRPAPVGHRQPRVIDVTDIMPGSPSQLRQQQLDRELDRKLAICKGC